MALNHKKTFTFSYDGREIVLETGRMAKQADASVVVHSGGTQVLVTVVSAKSAKDGQDFFPLTVDYTEKFYSAGKFLGGFLKREGRPSTGETLTARLIDRPLRPLFPEGYLNDTFIQATVLSYEPEGDPEVLASLGAAAALEISDIPFAGPLGTVKVGHIDGKLVANPLYDQWEHSELELLVSASKDAIMMVEGEGNEVSEALMLEAIDFAHDHCRSFCEVLDKMRAEVGREKREWTPIVPNTSLMEKVKQEFGDEAKKALAIVPKLERGNAVSALIKTVKEKLAENPAAFGLGDDADAGKEAAGAVDEMLYDFMRTDILKEGKRIGQRGLDVVREIEVEADVLTVPHGSSLFTRGETQVLAAATLGGSSGEQMSDRIQGLNQDRFYLHYNFPPFCVGDARGTRGVSRRELGHGNLAERALKKVFPSVEDFNYTVRVTCEVLESNGSSSMGSVCSGSMALLDAGVPLRSPVAGIAMGLIKEGEDYAILSDILGDEDHLGDMDFKVAGTEKGITAIQMDIKITGITKEIFTKAMNQAKDGRLHILGEMSKAISVPRKEYKNGVPRIENIQIKSDKIGALIGPGGKNVKAIQEDFGVNIEIDDSGLVRVIGPDRDKLNEVVTLIDLQINGPKQGDVFTAKVASIKDYGAFVDIAPGVSGLVHVSELADERVKDVSEYLDVGDSVQVKLVEVDNFGRLKLSAKAVTPLQKRES